MCLSYWIHTHTIGGVKEGRSALILEPMATGPYGPHSKKVYQTERVYAQGASLEGKERNSAWIIPRRS